MIVTERTDMDVVADVDGRGGFRNPVWFSYDSTDPLVVAVVFPDSALGPVEWQFARDLLDRGRRAMAGAGDVRVWPHGDRPGLLVIGLGSDDGSMQFNVPTDAVDRFLDRTYQVVPRGAERVDVDAGLAALLGGAW